LEPLFIDSFGNHEENAGHDQYQIGQQDLDEFGFDPVGEKGEIVDIIQIQNKGNDQHGK
jgi:hypothetical protein